MAVCIEEDGVRGNGWMMNAMIALKYEWEVKWQQRWEWLIFFLDVMNICHLSITFMFSDISLCVICEVTYTKQLKMILGSS